MEEQRIRKIWIQGDIAGTGSKSRMMDWVRVHMVDCKNILSSKRYERALVDKY